MVKVLAPLPADQAAGVGLLNAALKEDTRRIIRSTPFVNTPEDFAGAAGASFMRENIIASTFHELTDGDESRTVDDVAGYNPYSQLKSVYDKATLDRLKGSISDGEFDTVRSDRQLKATVDDILYEQDAQTKMASSPFGAIAGSILGAVFDPTSYIPMIGQASKLGTAGRIGLFAVNMALQTSVSEGILQMTQRDRSLSESLMNIGVSTVIGGGIGIFGGALHPKSLLNTGNVDNPLHPANLARDGEITRDLTGALDELTGDELADLRHIAAAPNASSVGAAAARDAAPVLARKEPKGPVGKLIRKAGDAFNSSTIKGQVLRSVSGPARWVGVRIFDPAGMLTEANLKGIASAKSATVLKSLYMSEYEKMSNTIVGAVRQLNGDLKLPLGKKVDLKDYYKLVQRQLYGMLDDKTTTELTQKYGQNFEAIRAEAAKTTETIHMFNQVWERRLTDAGLMQDPGHVSGLEGELVTARDALKAAKEATPDDLAGLNKIRAQRDKAIELLRIEKQKPTPLGRDYGHAQMWNRDAIAASPDDFKAYLHDVLALRPNEDWLLENHGMTLDDFDALAPDEARPFREEWAGDEYMWRIEQHEHDLAAATERAKQSKLDLMETLRALGVAKRDEADITLSEARTRRDALHVQIAANKANRAALEQEIRSFKEAATAARKAGEDRAARQANGEQTTLETARDQRVTQGAKLSDKLTKSLEDAITDPATPLDAAGNPRFLDAGDVSKTTDKVAEVNVKTAVAEAKVRQDMNAVSIETARQQGKAQEAALGLNKAIREGEELEARAVLLDQKLNEAESLHEAITRARRELEDTAYEARAARNLDAKTVAQIKRALKSAKGKTPLSELIDELYDALSRRGSLPHGILQNLMERSDQTTGRVKQRSLSLDKDQRVSAINNGWLRDDLSTILRMQTDQLASELSLREALDIGKGKQFESWDDVLQFIERDYDDMANGLTTPEEKGALTHEKKRTLANLIEARTRHIGGNFHDDGTASGWMNWTMSKAKQANQIRYGSGFTLSSLTDTATMVLRHGALMPLLFRYGKRAIKLMRSAYSDDPSHFQAMIQAMEIGMGAHAAARRYGTDDLLNGQMYGYGIGSGLTRKVTGAIDHVGEAMSEIGLKMGGLPLWNSFLKTVAGLSMVDKLASLAKRIDIPAGTKGALSPLEIADLASIGIGTKEAREIARFIGQHGKTDAQGFFDPHFELWDGADGIEAARNAEIALNRDMSRSINTPDGGDTPRMMSTPVGSLLLSFQTFAFTFTNQFAYPLAQRLSLYGDKQAMMSMGVLFGSAMLVLLGKDIINGRDPSERFAADKIGTTLYELVDRSGFLGYLSPYADSALKLTSGITGFNGGERYVRNGWAESLLGINYALFSDVQKAGSAVFGADPNVASKLTAIMPYAAQAKLLQRISELSTN